MFDIGWTELLVIGIVALIVVGPKDLPGMFRTLGRFTGKAKAMARDFQSAMNEAADSAGVKDVADDLKNVTSKKALGLDALDEVATKFENWDPMTPEAQAKAAETKAAEKAKKAALVKERTEAAKKMHAATAKAKDGKTAAKPAAKPKAKAPAKPKAKAAAKPKAPAKPKTAKPKAPAKPKAKAAKPKAKSGDKA
ncbi:Sec-independent protein translocase protein TatB [Profundibacter amoris]|uniref:Sec-independent protein translocase protein TatB n=1 Tax=Profundibacter amoris TaxID=2171755 RepID=A0A347UF65_9RHOB|nr:Sec-independent protein translocase protein TatB [Profundibacter amoris]AXX97493.1 twin-arginine translocase subunit TatB [Profundibacter amoris]